MIEVLCWMLAGGICFKVGEWIYRHIQRKNPEKIECEHDYAETDLKGVNVVYKVCTKCGSTTLGMHVPNGDFKTIEALSEKYRHR